MSEHCVTESSGRVIIGLRACAPGDLERPAAALWNEETEARYMEQVKQRAQDKAKEILNEALREAEQIRIQAHKDGFAQGLVEGQAVIEHEKSNIVAVLQNLETALNQERANVAARQQSALFELMRLAFEKTLGLVLDSRREEILEALLTEAVEHLSATASITVHVCPQDADHARKLIQEAREHTSGLPAFTVQTDPGLAPGGVRLESGDGVVDNAISSRLEQVRAALAALPDSA